MMSFMDSSPMLVEEEFQLEPQEGPSASISDNVQGDWTISVVEDVKAKGTAAGCSGDDVYVVAISAKDMDSFPSSLEFTIPKTPTSTEVHVDSFILNQSQLQMKTSTEVTPTAPNQLQMKASPQNSSVLLPYSATRVNKVKAAGPTSTDAPRLSEAASNYKCQTCGFSSNARAVVARHVKVVHEAARQPTPLSPRRAHRRVHELQRQLAGKSSALTSNAILLREKGAMLPDGGKTLRLMVGRMQRDIEKLQRELQEARVEVNKKSPQGQMMMEDVTALKSAEQQSLVMLAGMCGESSRGF